ncbi:MAG: 23S rRNA (pseudouridine(1915)-N(3))-methyltransferase RlmH [Segetibacter sp.]
MKIQLWAIGKSHEPYVKEGIEDFTKRISKYYAVDWRIFAPARQTVNSTEADIKKHEAQTILNYLQKDDYLVLLDEKGLQISSTQLASFIEQRANSSVRQLIFLIGGAFGVDEILKSRANFIWSFSHLVFPHQLVRLMLAEQIYRACSINRNEKYHHD